MGNGTIAFESGKRATRMRTSCNGRAAVARLGRAVALATITLTLACGLVPATASAGEGRGGY